MIYMNNLDDLNISDNDLSLGSNDSYIDTTIPMRINKKLSSIRYNLNLKIKNLDDKFEILNNKLSYIEDLLENLQPSKNNNHTNNNNIEISQNLINNLK